MRVLDRVKRGYVLVRQSISVMREHPRLALFPVVSGAASVAFLALVLTPMLGVLAIDTGDTAALVAGGGALVAAYLGMAFISAFFTAGLVHQTRAVLAGEEPSVRAGIRGAWEVKGPLFAWAVVSATIGVVLDAVAESDSIASQLLAAAFGVAWTLMTFFVVPVIVFENPSLKGMFTRSAKTFKQTFGETPIGLFGVNVVAMVAALPLLAPGAYLLFVAEVVVAGIPLFVGGILIAQLVSYTLQGVVKTSLYFYAAEDERPEEFDDVFDRLESRDGPSTTTGPVTGGVR